jgi:hypothetical protein
MDYLPDRKMDEYKNQIFRAGKHSLLKRCGGVSTVELPGGSQIVYYPSIIGKMGG